MDILKEVRALAGWPESGHLVISLYLNTKWRDEQQREKVRIFVKDRLKELERDLSGRRSRWEAVEEDVRFIRGYVDGLVARHHDMDYDGIAIFCCDHEGLRTVIRSRIPFANTFHVAPRPRIRPLARLYDEYETAVFADIGTSDADVYLIAAGEIDRHLRIENEGHKRHRQGGWSQARYGRHVEDLMNHHHKDVAGQLVRIVYESDVRNVILSGTEHVVASFRGYLPRWVNDHVLPNPKLDRNPPRDRVVRATIAALREAERAREEAVVRQIAEMRTNPAKVAEGLPGVLDALAHGRVHRLLLADTFEMEGFRCRACGKLDRAETDGCALCGEPVVACDLAEAMVVAAIQRGGEVDEVAGRPELEEMGGVAALLRY